MPRIRSLKPDLWNDEALGSCAPFAILLFIGLISQADDAGRLRAHPSRLRATLFPFREEINARKVTDALIELQQARVIYLYTVDGEQYAALRSWSKHQRVDRPSPSDLPAPPADSTNGREGSTTPREGSTIARPGEKRRGEEGSGAEGSRTREHSPLPDLPAYLDALRRLHPKFGREFAVTNALAGVAKLLPPLAEFEATLAAWAATEGWIEAGGKFVTNAAKWVEEGGFRDMPPKAKRSPAPARTVDQVRADDVKPALLSALKAKRLDRPTHDALLDRAAAATTIPELEAILREVPHAAA